MFFVSLSVDFSVIYADLDDAFAGDLRSYIFDFVFYQVLGFLTSKGRKEHVILV